MEAVKTKARTVRCQLSASTALEAAKATDPSAVEKGVADMALKDKDKVRPTCFFLKSHCLTVCVVPEEMSVVHSHPRMLL